MLIIDAYNVLHTRGVLPPELAGPGVPELVRLIGRSRYAKRSVSIVCDGTGTGSSGVRMGDVRVVFAGRHQEADDVIEAMVARFTHGRSLVVVSSDRRLRRAARRCGAVSLSSAAFLEEVVIDWGQRRRVSAGGGSVTAARVGPPLDPYSVEAWMREFGVEPSKMTPTPKPTTTPTTEPAVNPRGRPKPGPAFGDRLALPPLEAAPAEPQRPEPVAQPRAAEIRPTGDGGGLRAEDLDPVLREALEDWRDRLTLDDLDMRRWVPDADPTR